MSYPPSTLADMGEVVSLEDFRRSRVGARTQVGPARALHPIDRLSTAVRRLEQALGDAAGAEGFDEPGLRRELVAVNGAVSLGRYGFAAARTERLVERLLANA